MRKLGLLAATAALALTGCGGAGYSHSHVVVHHVYHRAVVHHVVVHHQVVHHVVVHHH